MVATAEAALEKPFSKRHRVRWAVAVVVVCLAGWIWLGVSADRVAEGAAILRAPGIPEQPGVDPFIDPLVIGYVHGIEVEITTSIANRGRFPITVTGLWMFPAVPLGPDDLMYLLLRQERVLIEDEGDFPSDGELREPIDLDERSVTIAPGEEHAVTFVARFGDCDQFFAGSGNAFDVLRVDYRHLGIPQSVDVSTRRVEVESPALCPIR
jgi:hypothetical protein